jgi:guanylate kinase
MSGKMIVICAPSGTGKSTLLARLKSEHPNLEWSVSCTTREMRSGELDGRDYHFLKIQDFQQQIEDGLFIEWALVHSNYYGTSRKFVDEGLKQGKKMLFDLDVQGADAVKSIYGDTAQIIFIEPPSLAELENRLRVRGTDGDKTIQERVENARKEIIRKNDYDYLILNDDVDKAYNLLKSVVENILGK